ncbi:MAG: helix-turn-helix transcriptional regulator [Bacteroidota bacterium]
MLTLNLQPVFKARGIDKPYSFLVSAGFPSYTAHNLLNAKTVSFRLSYIDKLCAILNCTPNELLVCTQPQREINGGSSNNKIKKTKYGPQLAGYHQNHSIGSVK